MIGNGLANYDREQELFTELVASDFGPQILLMHGKSGIGKSTFIQYCIQNLPDTPYALLDLHNGAESLSLLFIRLGNICGWKNLPNFTQTVATLLEQPTEIDNPLWHIQMRRHIRKIGKINDLESRLSRYQLLADAWFYDVEQFENPLLLIIDKYENSSTLFDRWFTQVFLEGVADSQRMRVLVSGQKIPTMEYNWRFFAKVQELRGVTEADIWLDWATKAGYKTPSLEEMTEIVEILEGNPSQIIEVIKTQFPRISGVMKLKLSTAELTSKMERAFNLPELKNICIDLGIRYENLPDHEILSRLVREIVAYTSRTGILHELIQLCQSMRPAVFQTSS